MKKIIFLLCLILTLFVLCGCDQVIQQAETIAQQLDVETAVQEIMDRIDTEEIKRYAKEGYSALTNRFPALKSENVKAFLKDNGLDLMRNYLDSTDVSMQENARKLGEILKILEPDLTDEVDHIIG